MTPHNTHPSTDEPPIEITNIPLKEYINDLRRRVEVQLRQMDNLSQQLYEARKTRNAITELFYQNVRQLQSNIHKLYNPPSNPK